MRFFALDTFGHPKNFLEYGHWELNIGQGSVSKFLPHVKSMLKLTLMRRFRNRRNRSRCFFALDTLNIQYGLLSFLLLGFRILGQRVGLNLIYHLIILADIRHERAVR